MDSDVERAAPGPSVYHNMTYGLWVVPVDGVVTQMNSIKKVIELALQFWEPHQVFQFQFSRSGKWDMRKS